jgi:hypothetical protein
MSLTRDQRILLEDKLDLWREAAKHVGRDPDYADYHRRAVEALEELFDTADDYRERLHDVVLIEAEADAIGGGPRFKERHAKAWNQAREPFEP